MKTSELKVTRISHCQVCDREFYDNEFVYFAVLDNNIICEKCSSVHNVKYLEPRIFEREGSH